MNCPACNQPLPTTPEPPTPDTTGAELVPLDEPSRARVDRRRRDAERGVFVSKFDERTREKIVGALRGGAPFETAAAFAGISRATLYNWFRDGRAENAPEELREFMDEVDEAIATWEVGAVATLTSLGNAGQARALEFLLAARFPDRYGRRVQRVEHANADGQPFLTQQTMIDPERLTENELSLLLWLVRKATPPSQPTLEGNAR